jgi:molecular chaperone HscB
MKRGGVVVEILSMSNPFEVFQLPVFFDIDMIDLDKRYVQLQDLCHPDRHNDSFNRGIFEKKSIEITNSYNILRDVISRAEAVLNHHMIDQNDFADSSILMEMMSLQEAIEDGKYDVEFLSHVKQKSYEDLLQKFLTSDFVGANKELYRYKFLSKMKVN